MAESLLPNSRVFMGTSQEAAEEARNAEQKRPEVDFRSPRLFFNSDTIPSEKHLGYRKCPLLLDGLFCLCDACLELR